MAIIKSILYNLVSDEFSKSFIETLVRKFPNLEIIVVFRTNSQEVSLINKKIKIIYLDYEEVVKGNYNSVESESFVEIIESNYKSAFLSLKMMDRLGSLIDLSIDLLFYLGGYY